MPKKILIRTPNFIGDTIMMLPALELVRRHNPEAYITIVCREHSRDIFRGKGIHQIIVDDTKGRGRCQKTFRLIRKLRKESYDLGILFHNSFLTALVFRLSRVKNLVGYDNEGRGFLLNRSEKILRSRHYVNHYAHLVNTCLNYSEKLLPKMKLTAEKTDLLKKTIRPLVGFVLGGEHKDTKGVRSYPRSSSIELCVLLKDLPIDIVFLGDKFDAHNHNVYADELRKNGANVQDITGRTTVGELIDSIAMLDLLVTIDTSTMHISAGVDTYFLMLQGVGTSAIDSVFPKGKKGEKIYSGDECIEDKDVIKAIKPQYIYDRIVEIIDKKAIFGLTKSHL